MSFLFAASPPTRSPTWRLMIRPGWVLAQSRPGTLCNSCHSNTKWPRILVAIRSWLLSSSAASWGTYIVRITHTLPMSQPRGMLTSILLSSFRLRLVSALPPRCSITVNTPELRSEFITQAVGSERDLGSRVRILQLPLNLRELRWCTGVCGWASLTVLLFFVSQRQLPSCNSIGYI